MTQTLAAWTPRALSILRIITGLLIIQHGMAKLIGFPALPITLTLVPLPLPVKYHLHFGAPLWFEGNPDDEDTGLERRVREVKVVIQAMLDAGRVSRKSIFF